MQDELKACPFCGGEAERAHQEAQRGLGKAVYIWCPNCGSRTGLSWSGSAEAITAWNARADPALAAAQAEVARLTAEVERLRGMSDNGWSMGACPSVPTVTL